MIYDSIINRIKPGAAAKLKTRRVVKVKRNAGKVIEKEVSYDGIRLGLNYDNLSETKMLRNTGDLNLNSKSLAWGQWDRPLFTIKHNDSRYLRFYTTPAAVRTQWYIDGEKADYNTVEGYLQTSEKRRAKDRYQMGLTVKFENIVELSNIINIKLKA